MQISLWEAVLIALLTYLATSVWPLGVGYFTLYRPLVAGTLVGLILGDVQRGMAFGAALNAVHLGFISTGGSLPSDLAIAGYVGTALALASGLDVDAALAAFGISLGILGGFLWFGRMTLGAALMHWADARAEMGDVRGVAAVNLWAGQGLLFLFYAVPSFIIVYYGQQGIDAVLSLIPERLIAALAVVGGLLPAVGIGLLLRSMGRARLMPYFMVGFILAMYLDLPLLVIAALAAAAAWLTVKLPAASLLAEPAQRQSAQSIPRPVLWGAWWRWAMFLHASYNYERMQGAGFAHTMAPVIKYLYKTPADRAAALRRHLSFFNTEPQIGALAPAVVIAMEEERAAGAEVTDEAISGVKSGLMGPLAGVGDSLFQGAITPLLLSIGISLAQQGHLSGPTLYVLFISVMVLGSSYGFWSLGYRLGKSAVSRILASGWLQAISDGAAIVGLAVLGGLAATVVQFSTPVLVAVGSTAQAGQAAVSVQKDVLDAILRGLLPLALIAGVWWLLRRRIPAVQIIVMLFALGIDLTYLGLAGWTSLPLFSREWAAFLVGGEGATVFSILVHWCPPLLATGVAAIILLRQRGKKRPG